MHAVGLSEARQEQEQAESLQELRSTVSGAQAEPWGLTA